MKCAAWIELFVFKNNYFNFSNANKDGGFEIQGISNGAVNGNLDNDGDVDLWIKNVKMKDYIKKNNTKTLIENNFIKLKFIGKQSNKFAIGTSVKLYYDDNIVIQELVSSR